MIDPLAVSDAPDYSWLPNVDDLTLMRIYDVICDIETHVNIAKQDAKCIRIPQYDSHVKFEELCPSRNADTAIKYAYHRGTAAEFLADRKALRSVYINGDYWMHREIQIFFDRPIVMEAIARVKEEFNRRAKAPRPSDAPGLKEMLHPEVVQVAWQRMLDGHLADAAEAAMKHVNFKIKQIVRDATGQDLDGKTLMEHAFSVGRPVIVLDDLSTESGRNVQIGYMTMMSGAITGIRNPKAHANLDIDEVRCIHFLFVASLFLYKLDERIGPR